MKSNNNYIWELKNFILIALVIIAVSGCQKDIEEPEWEVYAPTDIDITGGTWKPVMVSFDSVSVTTPEATTSAAYAGELQSLKTIAASITSEQKKKVFYWSFGAMRWNEIARDLVAKYNLAPEASSDGTYPFPDATKPSDYPLFPFANPPYACRAYAYLSVAQYDALVATWYYKYLHQRPSPSTVDPSITPLLSSYGLPSYPSEDAVIAAASCAVLKAMFPLEVANLDAKLAEHQNSRLWAGANVISDIVAGDALGKAVAAKVMARATTDGFGAAKGTPAIWDSLETLANSTGTSWVSMEVPPRPPQLPLFGNVKLWTFDNATKIMLRPTPPPAVGSLEFQYALDEIKDFSQNLTREQYRIADFWSDGISTYTPPGHWNRIACDLFVKYRFNQIRITRALALLNMSLQDAGICCWDAKTYYYYPRPTQMDPAITTAIGLPNFPSYTSGHSTFSGAAATVLGYIFPQESGDLLNMAKEASVSRLYAAIHYRFDCEAGLICGKNIGQYAVAIGQSDGSP